MRPPFLVDLLDPCGGSSEAGHRASVLIGSLFLMSRFTLDDVDDDEDPDDDDDFREDDEESDDEEDDDGEPGDEEETWQVLALTFPYRPA